jgi:hypothetical protein
MAGSWVPIAAAMVALVALMTLLPMCFLGAAVLQATPMLYDEFSDGSLALLLGSTDIFRNATAQPTYGFRDIRHDPYLDSPNDPPGQAVRA